MKQIKIKAGSILLYRKYNWLSKLWNKLCGKELPYNKFTPFCQETVLYNSSNVDKQWCLDCILLEPKKNYSSKEVAQFYLAKQYIVNNYNKISPDFEDVQVIINSVRPETIDITTDVTKLVDNRFYRTRRLNDASEYEEYLY